MLFIHKEATRFVGLPISIYTGQIAKGNEADYLLVLKNGDTPKDTNKEIMYNEVEKDVKKTFDLIGVAFDPNCADKLKEWVQYTEYDRGQKNIYAMMSPDGMKARASSKIGANWRYYNNYIDLALAIYGEIKSRDNDERHAAEAVKDSPKVKKLLTGVTRRINAKINTCDYSDGFKKAFKSLVGSEPAETNWKDCLVKGKYTPLNVHETTQNVTDWASWEKCVATGDDIGLGLIPVLYNITMIAGRAFGWEENEITVHYKRGLSGESSRQIDKDDMRSNVSTVNEDHFWTQLGRWRDLPLWAGPSFTAQCMLFAAQKSDASKEEFQALAYSIFAFWNLDYPHTATPVHRLYEVTSAAEKFVAIAGFNDPKQIYAVCLAFCN